MQTRRQMFSEACQAFVLTDYPDAKHVPEPGVRPEEQDEPQPAPEPLRCFLRGCMV